MDDSHEYHRIEGIWYLITFKWDTDFALGEWLNPTPDGCIEYHIGEQCCLGPHVLTVLATDEHGDVGAGQAWVRVVR